jgi:HEAT repeat protein
MTLFTTRMRGIRAAASAAVAACLLLPPVFAQSQEQAPTMPSAAIPTAEAAAIAQYWVLFAEGKFDEAAKTIGGVVSRYPKNVAVLTLLVETDIARGGALTALKSYEGWLGTREVEEPGVLRRIARAVLIEWARQAADTNARNEALVVLASDGDLDAAAAIARMRQARTESGLRMAVQTGDPAAIDAVSERIRLGSGLRMRDLSLLAQSNSPRAVPVLVEMLKDSNPENRASAADALGKIGGAEAEGALAPMLSDPHGLVRNAAAAALFRNGNFSGAGILREMADNESCRSNAPGDPEACANFRITAARLMASRPDEEWKALVRGLLNDPNASIRLDAALMLAPHDPAATRPVLDALNNDPNIAIREAVQMAEADQSTSSLPTLRGLLRTGEAMVRVRAAARILALTR